MRRILVLLAAFAGLALGACGRRETAVESGIREGFLHLGIGGEPRDLDPSTNVGSAENVILSAEFEGLLNWSPDARTLVPACAERWETSPDGRVFTFHLRPGLRWSNGDPLTAADFLFSFRRAIAPALASENAPYAYWVAGAQDYNEGKTHDITAVGFRAPDPLTFEITLKDRTPFFAAYLTVSPFYPLHRPTLEKSGALLRRDTGWTKPGSDVSNGPFRLASWRPNDRVVLEKNPYYWDAARVRLKQVHFHSIDNPDSEERAFRGGQLHATWGLPLDKVATYRRQHPELLHSHELLGHDYVTFNTARSPFDRAPVRRAFALAVDRAAIANDIYRDGRSPAVAQTQPGAGGYTPKAQLKYNPDEARALLAQAGYPGGAGFPEVTYTFTVAKPGWKDVAEALQAMWSRELGVHVTLAQQEYKVWLDTLRGKNFQLAADDWLPSTADPVEMLQLELGGSPGNDSGWISPAYDEHFAAAARARTDAERWEHFQAMDAILLEEMPTIPLVYGQDNYLLDPAVRGWVDNSLKYHPLQSVSLERGSSAGK